MKNISYLTAAEVCNRIKCCRSWLYVLVARGDFPKPLKRGKRSLWLESEVDEHEREFVAAAKAARDNGAAPR